MNLRFFATDAAPCSQVFTFLGGGDMADLTNNLSATGTRTCPARSMAAGIVIGALAAMGVSGPTQAAHDAMTTYPDAHEISREALLRGKTRRALKDLRKMQQNAEDQVSQQKKWEVARQRRLEQEAILEGTRQEPSLYEIQRVMGYFKDTPRLLSDLAMTQGYKHPGRWGSSPGEVQRILSKLLPDVSLKVKGVDFGLGSTIRGALELSAEGAQQYEERAVLDVILQNLDGAYAAAKQATAIEIEIARAEERARIAGELEPWQRLEDDAASWKAQLGGATSVEGSVQGEALRAIVKAQRERGVMAWQSDDEILRSDVSGTAHWISLHKAVRELRDAQRQETLSDALLMEQTQVMVEVGKRALGELKEREARETEALERDDTARYVKGESEGDIQRENALRRATSIQKAAEDHLTKLGENATPTDRAYYEAMVRNAKRRADGIRKQQRDTDAYRAFAQVQAVTHAAVAVSQLIPDRDVQEAVWLISETVNIGGNVALAAVTGGPTPQNIAAIATSVGRIVEWYQGKPSQDALIQWSLEAIGESIALVRRDIAQVSSQIALVHEELSRLAYQSRRALTGIRNGQTAMRSEVLAQFDTLRDRMEVLALEREEQWTRVLDKEVESEVGEVLGRFHNWRERPGLKEDILACQLEQHCSERAQQALEDFYRTKQKIAEKFKTEQGERGRDVRSLSTAEAKAALTVPLAERRIDLGSAVLWLLETNGSPITAAHREWVAESTGVSGADARSARWLDLYFKLTPLTPIRTPEGTIIRDRNIGAFCAVANSMATRRSRLETLPSLAMTTYVEKLATVRDQIVTELDEIAAQFDTRFGALVPSGEGARVRPEVIGSGHEEAVYRRLGFYEDEVITHLKGSMSGECLNDNRIEDPEMCDFARWKRDALIGSRDASNFVGVLMRLVTMPVQAILDRRRENAIEEEQRFRQSCPVLYKRYRTMCTTIRIGSPARAVAALAEAQQQVVQHLLSRVSLEERRQLTLARLVLDTIMRETLGAALEHGEEYAHLRRLLARLPDGDDRWILMRLAHTEPHEVFAWLDRTVREDLPKAQDPVQSVALIAGWASGSDAPDRTLGDWVNRAQLERCETAEEGNARRAVHERVLRDELFRWIAPPEEATPNERVEAHAAPDAKPGLKRNEEKEWTVEGAFKPLLHGKDPTTTRAGQAGSGKQAQEQSATKAWVATRREQMAQARIAETRKVGVRAECLEHEVWSTLADRTQQQANAREVAAPSAKMRCLKIATRDTREPTIEVVETPIWAEWTEEGLPRTGNDTGAQRADTPIENEDKVDSWWLKDWIRKIVGNDEQEHAQPSQLAVKEAEDAPYTALDACRDNDFKRWTRIVLARLGEPGGLENEIGILEHAHLCDTLRAVVDRYHNSPAEQAEARDLWWTTLALAAGDAARTPTGPSLSCEIARAQWGMQPREEWKQTDRGGNEKVDLPVPVMAERWRREDPIEQVRKMLETSQSQPDLVVHGGCFRNA